MNDSVQYVCVCVKEKVERENLERKKRVGRTGKRKRERETKGNVCRKLVEW